MQSDDRRARPHAPGGEPFERRISAQDQCSDVLVFIRPTVYSACTLEVRAPAIDTDALAAAPRARVVIRDSRQRVEVEPGFLVRFASHYILRALTVLDDAGDRLDHPGFVTGRERSGTKLLDQNHRIENWVAGQDGDRVPAFENRALDRPTPAAAKQAMSECVAIDANRLCTTFRRHEMLRWAWL